MELFISDHCDRMHIGTHFTAYEMEKDNRRKRFASTHHNHIMVNKTRNSNKKSVKKNKEDLKGIQKKHYESIK